MNATAEPFATEVQQAFAQLRTLLGPGGIIADPDELVVYECDGFTIPRARPLAVVFPTHTQHVSEILKILSRHHLAVLPRGSGTGLCGGIVAVTPGVQVSTARMKTIHQIDVRNRWALVDAGVLNLRLSDAIADAQLHFAPDPSSQRASTIGGNVATNAGGLHTLKYGVTVNHILGVEVVLADGSIHVLGGPHGHDIGPDFTGLICGTEGTLALITRVWCRLIPKPRAFRTALAIFDSTQHCCQTVADLIAAGIIPAALEMMDGAMIRIVEDAFHLGFPRSAQALLLIEVDGPEIGLEEDMNHIEQLARKNNATDIQRGSDPARRDALWSARRRAFAAIGRVSPSYCTQDACIPRSKLPMVIAKIAEICTRHHLQITNVFHAGDGNVHPVLMYDENDPAAVQRTLEASGEILRFCISVGGTVTGEHGVGIEKLPYMRDMFSPDDLHAMHRIRRALVTDDQMNPFKVLPRDGVTIDLEHPQRHVPQ